MTVSLAVVARNEERHLPRLLEDLRRQDYPHEKLELLLIDSASTDGTRALMESFAREKSDFARVVVLDNPGKILPCGCNVALGAYTGDAFVRIDAHASIPTDFLTKSVAVLEQGEAVCGGRRPCIIENDTPWHRTLLCAEQSMFGSSPAAYRSGGKKQYVSSVFHGIYRREVYDRVGLYDERLARTEDNDMSQRIRQAGYRICFDPDICSYQYIRSSLGGMLRQKFSNARWIGRTMGINPRCFSLFHFVPLAFLLAILVSAGMAAWGLWLPAALLWGAYGLVVLSVTALELIRQPSGFKLLLPFLFLLLHLTYGTGTLLGLLELPFRKK